MKSLKSSALREKSADELKTLVAEKNEARHRADRYSELHDAAHSERTSIRESDNVSKRDVCQCQFHRSSSCGISAV